MCQKSENSRWIAASSLPSEIMHVKSLHCLSHIGHVAVIESLWPSVKIIWAPQPHCNQSAAGEDGHGRCSSANSTWSNDGFHAAFHGVTCLQLHATQVDWWKKQSHKVTDFECDTWQVSEHLNLGLDWKEAYKRCSSEPDCFCSCVQQTQLTASRSWQSSKKWPLQRCQETQATQEKTLLGSMGYQPPTHRHWHPFNQVESTIPPKCMSVQSVHAQEDECRLNDPPLPCGNHRGGESQACSAPST